MIARRSALHTFAAAAAAIVGSPMKGKPANPPQPVIRDDARVTWSMELRGNNVVVTEGSRSVSIAASILSAFKDPDDRRLFIQEQFSRPA